MAVLRLPPDTGEVAAVTGRFVGIDLAWKAGNRTGIAVADDSGRLLASAVVRSDDEIADWLGRHVPRPSVVAVDAPLVVPNETGQRLGENLVAKAFGRYGASPYPSNRGNPLFDPPRASELAARFGWTTDPGRRGGAGRPACIEVYPHPAMVALFGLDRVLPYKSGRGRTPQARRASFLLLMQHLEAVEPLAVAGNDRWRRLRSAVAEATRQMHLEAVEDELDAVLCAHLAWLWHHEPDALVVYGTAEAGYVVAPPAPHAIAK